MDLRGRTGVRRIPDAVDGALIGMVDRLVAATHPAAKRRDRGRRRRPRKGLPPLGGSFGGMSRDGTRLGGTRAGSNVHHRKSARELSGRHPALARLVSLADPIERIIPDQRPLSHLVVRTVVGQLVSTAAARTIMERLLAAHGDVEGIISWAMTVDEDAPPAYSLSRAKRKAIAHWGRFVAAHGDPREHWRTQGAEELIASIVALRGLGRWSAHMIAIFGFGHPEIWPDGDAGVMRVARVAFRGIRKASLRKLIRGHETYVALCCWAVLDRGRLAELAGGAVTSRGSRSPRPRRGRRRARR